MPPPEEVTQLNVPRTQPFGVHSWIVRDDARPTFATAVRAELAHAFRAPYEIPLVVVGNGLLVVILWFSPLSRIMFSLHGALAFPIVLGSWMYADVPATNVVGSDRRMLEVLDDEPTLMRMLAAKSAVLWIFVAPLCVLIALIIGTVDARPAAVLWTVIVIAVVPLGALALSDCVGILWPYRAVSLRHRWQDRRNLRTQVRWLVLICLPYAVVPAVIVLMAMPALGWWRLETGGTQGQASDVLLAEVALVACATSLVMWFVGRAASRRLLRRRREHLRAYLADPASA